MKRVDELDMFIPCIEISSCESEMHGYPMQWLTKKLILFQICM